MAVEETTPHGIKKYTSGTDLIPGRAGHNNLVDLLNKIPGLGIGPLSARPTPEFGLRFWVEESTNRLYVNTGTVWAGIAEVGGVEPGLVAAGGTASEGSSFRAARADHSHRLPLATAENAGAMSSTDKKLLDAATSYGTPSSLVYRDSNNRFDIGSIGVSAAPVGVSDAVRKDYVDSKIVSHGHGDATSATPGFMPAADKAKLDAATSGNIPSSIVRRGSTNGFNVNYVGISLAPTIASDATNKKYVDEKTWPASAINSGVFDPARIQVASQVANGLLSAADKTKLDKISTIGEWQPITLYAAHTVTSYPTEFRINNGRTELRGALKKGAGERYLTNAVSITAARPFKGAPLILSWATDLDSPQSADIGIVQAAVSNLGGIVLAINEPASSIPAGAYIFLDGISWPTFS